MKTKMEVPVSTSGLLVISCRPDPGVARRRKNVLDLACQTFFSKATGPEMQ